MSRRLRSQEKAAAPPGRCGRPCGSSSARAWTPMPRPLAAPRTCFRASPAGSSSSRTGPPSPNTSTSDPGPPQGPRRRPQAAPKRVSFKRAPKRALGQGGCSISLCSIRRRVSAAPPSSSRRGGPEAAPGPGTGPPGTGTPGTWPCWWRTATPRPLGASSRRSNTGVRKACRGRIHRGYGHVRCGYAETPLRCSADIDITGAAVLNKSKGASWGDYSDFSSGTLFQTS
mmetsp:Transcript_12913/g.30445  ORF Transcript_12913/g.30445 Transcript_12913/m.30445 type:complete len:228 (-) Transcript_12913:180-863(-)